MEKVLYCFYKIILKIRANLKRHNRVYILSSKHTYRPMRARVVAQLFYKKVSIRFNPLDVSILISTASRPKPLMSILTFT